MKKLISISVIFALISSQSFAQNGGIIVKLNEEQLLYSQLSKYGNQVRLSFSNEKVDRILESCEIISFTQAFPLAKEFKHEASKRLSLLYRIEGQFDYKNMVEALRETNFFEVVEEINEPIPLYVPNDLGMQDAQGQIALTRIKAKDAWNITKGNTNIKIAIIDNGFDVNHEDIINQVVYQDGNVNWTGVGFSHGGMVAGVAACETDNNKGLSSIGFNSKLMLYKSDNPYNKMMHASLNGARVINCSFLTRCNTPSAHEQDIINMIVANGTIIVAAAGNGTVGNHCYGDWNNDGVLDQNGYVYPASYYNVISVSGATNNDTYSQGTSHLTFNDKVDLTAPGWSVATTYDNNSYYYASGSSFASPLVAGTVALMLSVKSCLTQKEVEFILKWSADSSINNIALYPANQSFANISGAGILDSYKAVSMTSNWPQILTSIATTTGPSLVCTSNSTFTLQNVPVDYTISWTRSSNLTQVSGQGTSSYVVRANNSSVSGAGWVRATINGPCGQVILPQRNFWVGKPSIQLTNIDNSVCMQPHYTFCGPLVDGQANYQWSLNTSNLNIVGSGRCVTINNTGGVLHGQSQNFTLNLTMNSSPFCNTTNSINTSFYQPTECYCGIQIIGCGGGGGIEPNIVLTPNPTDDGKLTITFEDLDALKSYFSNTSDIPPLKVLISSFSGEETYKGVITKSGINVNLRHARPGLYIVRVYGSGYDQYARLVIQ